MSCLEQVTDAHVDMFDREAVFIQKKLIPVLEMVGDLGAVLLRSGCRRAAIINKPLGPDSVRAVLNISRWAADGLL
jgi:hypothetical protein